MRWLMLLMMCLILNTVTVKAAEHNAVPNVVGMSEEEAKQILESYVLPGGKTFEVIVQYEYHSEVQKGKIIAQETQRAKPGQTGDKVVIRVSLGEEPNEYLGGPGEKNDAAHSFGISEYVDLNNTESKFGINWSALPESYEYIWDNSLSCWQWGVWIDGVQYKTPEGEYDTNVRHKVQGYCDGTYVYMRLVMSRDYGDRMHGDDYRFYLDENAASFQLKMPGGEYLTNEFPKLEPGTYCVEVVHANYGVSGDVVTDAVAYVTKHDDRKNAVLEMKIPLSEMQRQNAKIDLWNLSVIEMYCPNLMYRRFTLTGASTFPFALAAVAFVVVPASTVLLKKYRKRKDRNHD